MDKFATAVVVVVLFSCLQLVPYSKGFNPLSLMSRTGQPTGTVKPEDKVKTKFVRRWDGACFYLVCDTVASKTQRTY